MGSTRHKDTKSLIKNLYIMKKLFLLIPLLAFAFTANATVPSTDFASPYSCAADDAVLSGTAPANKFYLQSESTPHYIGWSDVKMLDAHPDADDAYTAVATWTINATRACYVSVTLDLGPVISSNKHIFEVKILDAEGTVMGAVREGPAYTGDGFTTANEEKDLSGQIIIPAAGEYTIELRNNRDYCKGSIKNVILKYAGEASVTDFASEYILTAGDADLSGDLIYETGGPNDPYLRYNHSWKPGTATWSIYATRACYINALVNMADNMWNYDAEDPARKYFQNHKHVFVIEVYDASSTIVGSAKEGDYNPDGSSDGYSNYPTVNLLGSIRIPAPGAYTIKLLNPRNESRCGVESVTLTYAGGATQNIPGTITLSDAVRSPRAYLDGGDLHFTDADHIGTISGEYAKWMIHVAEEGAYYFTATCTGTEGWSNLTISVLDGDENELHTYTPQYSYKQANKEIVSPDWFFEAGDYVLKLSNPVNHSNGYLTSLSASAASNVLVVDENATDMQYIKDLNGLSRKPVLKRSFVANMYNTVLFPFNGVTNAELESIFGVGYELLEMSSATMEGDVLVLEFAAVDLSGSTYGRPYLIKPTKNVTDPLFKSTTIYASTSHLTQEKGVAKFIGSYVKTSVPAGNNNLFLGSGNKLYFSSESTPIKATRAYFAVSEAAGAPARACIVTKGNVVTEIDLVNGELPETFGSKVQKVIVNGQLILVKDGVEYNTLGVRVK